MAFYSFFLLLLLLGETYSLHVREESPKHPAQCTETTETIFWQATSDAGVAIPATVTRTCRDRSPLARHHRSLVKRVPPGQKSKNIFDAICQRERTGSRLTRTHTVDIEVPINDHEGSTQVTTPHGGVISLWADQHTHYIDWPNDLRLREQLDMTIINNSPCEISIEWMTRLRLYPEHGVGEGQPLAPRSLDAVPRDNASTSLNLPRSCYCLGLQPVHDVLAIAVRLLITAFDSVGG